MGKFTPKKSAPRKYATISPLNMDAAERACEFGLDYNNAHLTLGDKEFQFDPENGEWYEDTESPGKHGGGGGKSRNQGLNGKDFDKLKSKEKTLQEENNLLHIKNDLLLDMISEVYSEMKLETETKKGLD